MVVMRFSHLANRVVSSNQIGCSLEMLYLICTKPYGSKAGILYNNHYRRTEGEAIFRLSSLVDKFRTTLSKNM